MDMKLINCIPLVIEKSENKFYYRSEWQTYQILLQ